MAVHSESIIPGTSKKASDHGGQNPNAMYAALLQDSIDKFCKESTARHSKTQPFIQNLLDNTTESSFDTFLDTLNEKSSVINKECINKIMKVFSYVQVINVSTRAINSDLNRLFGILRCTLILGHKICDGSRDVAGKLELMGMWMKNVKEEEHESIVVLWDLLAQYAIAVVQFCTAVISLDNRVQVLMLEPKLLDIQRVNSLIEKENEAYCQELAEQEERRQLHLASEEEAKKKNEGEVESLKNWLGEYCKDINRSRHTTLSDVREPSTGEWFVKAVNSWLKNDDEQVLWAAGSPGVGKSVLVSALVDHYTETKLIESRAQVATARRGTVTNIQVEPPKVKHMAYIYFAYDEQKDQSPLAVYTHLLRQLYPACDSLHASLEKVRSKIESTKTENKLLVEEFATVLKNLKPNVLLVFDALDEANAEMQSKFKSWIKSFPTESSPRIVLLTRADVQKPYTSSRRVPALIKSLPIEASSMDMKKFIKGQLGRHDDVMRIIKRTLKKKKVEPWIEKQATIMLKRASSMFLLVSLQIRDVCSKRTVSDMEEAANKESRDPNAIYSKTWGQITAVGDATLPRRVIGLLTFAKRTLNAEELTAALSTKPSIYTIDPKNKHFPEDLEASCRGLVVIDRQSSSQRLRLAHQTVQEYFFQAPEFQKMQLEFCNICFTYLVTVLRPSHPVEEDSDSEGSTENDSDSESDQEIEFARDNFARLLTFASDSSKPAPSSSNGDWGNSSDDNSFLSTSSNGYRPSNLTNLCNWLRTVNPAKYPLLRYAGEHAIEHLKAISCDEEATQILLDFVNSAFSTRRQNTIDLQLKTFPQPPQKMTKLHLATILGIQSVVEVVLDQGRVDLQATDEEGRTSLVYALEYGADEVAKLLLAKGADVNALDSDGDSVLWYCAFTSNQGLIDQIAENTAVQHIKHETLQMAVYESNLPLVKAILDRATFDTGPHNMLPLSLALERGNGPIAMELLKRGMDPERRDGEGKTPLILATEYAQYDVIDLLISMEVDVHKKDDEANTALHFAVLKSAVLVQKLVEASADPRALNNDGLSPLALALDNGQSDVSSNELRKILETLVIDRSIILNPSRDKTTALHIAASQSNTTAFKFFMDVLEEAGPEALNRLDDKGRSPLMSCIHKRLSSFVEFILDNYAAWLDYGVESEDGGSYLQQAAAWGNSPAVIERLIQACPQLVNQKTRSRESPLFASIFHQNIPAFRVLVSYNARCRDDAETRDTICHALEQGMEGVVETLLTLGLENTSWTNEDSIALMMSAVSGGSLQLLDLIMSMKSVDRECHTVLGYTPIQQAILSGHVDILERLIATDFKIKSLTNAGKSALDFALERGDPALIKTLVEHDAYPGLEWREFGTSIHKWAEEPWFPQLKSALKSSITTSWTGARVEIDETWQVERVSRAEHVGIDQNDDESPYLEVKVPLGGNFPVRRIRFTTDSHDQGWSDDAEKYGGSYRHSWTWFEAAVLKQDQTPVQRRTIQVNVHADQEFRTHVNQWDFRDTSPGVREWLGAIQSGDTIQVFPRALYAGWCNYVRNVEVVLYCDIQSTAV